MKPLYVLFPLLLVTFCTDSLTFTALNDSNDNIAGAQASYQIPETGNAVVYNAENLPAKTINYLKTINLYS